MSVLMYVISIVGVLGVGGTIAAAILFPAVVIPVVQSIATSILKCKPCLIVLAILASLFVGALYGAHVEKAKCRAGQLEAELRNKQIDLDNARKATDDESERAKSIEAQSNDQQAKDKAYIATLEARPACVLDDGDIGLRQPARSGRAKSPAYTK